MDNLSLSLEWRANQSEREVFSYDAANRAGGLESEVFDEKDNIMVGGCAAAAGVHSASLFESIRL